MSQVTNLAFFRARRGQSEELGDDADLWFVYENWRLKVLTPTCCLSTCRHF